MRGGDEGVHPPVGGFGEQVDERLQEANAEVLQVFGRLHLSRVGETNVALLAEDRTQREWRGETKSSRRHLRRSVVLQDCMSLPRAVEL